MKTEYRDDFVFNLMIYDHHLAFIISNFNQNFISQQSSKVDLYSNFSSSRPSLGASGFIHDKRRTNRLHIRQIASHS